MITFLNKEKEKLFSIFTFPENKQRVTAVIMVHGFAKTKSERKFVGLARKLVKKGIASLRFDFSGCGDSEGKFEEMRITKQVEELNAAYQRLTKEKIIDKDRIGIFAHSLGTVIACLFQVKFQTIKCLALVAPALDQEKLIKNWYEASEIEKWEKQGYLDTKKGRIGIGYLEEAVDYTEILPKIKIPTLVVHGEEDEDIPVEMAKKVFEKIGAEEKEMAVIEEADHHFESYWGRQEIIDLSINWFKKYL